jgi:hypothetical protein
MLRTTSSSQQTKKAAKTFDSPGGILFSSTLSPTTAKQSDFSNLATEHPQGNGTQKFSAHPKVQLHPSQLLQ